MSGIFSSLGKLKNAFAASKAPFMTKGGAHFLNHTRAHTRVFHGGKINDGQVIARGAGGASGAAGAL
ncbi:unnamed protein product [Cuscuta campestris]|uniref:Uncharacterized protein n=1 Tax=Cuscuta campestris TaxID=132261 RepID=A0A484LH03_9ASTE|nr:unnamed protein product [Cuscuta campestris]